MWSSREVEGGATQVSNRDPEPYLQKDLAQINIRSPKERLLPRMKLGAQSP